MNGSERALRGRRTYKDSMFRDLFGMPEHALSLYNALNGSNYDDPSVIEITTLKDVIYLNVKNDVSFLIGDELVLWEHQTSYNPNMPLRGLQYFARLYSSWVDAHDELNVYGSKRIMLPTARYVVFYMGLADRPQRSLMKLSDSFVGNEGPASLEVIAEVRNINEQYLGELGQACPTLAGYAHFVALVRGARENGLSDEEAIDQALQRCVNEGLLVEYLSRKRAEVKDMFMTEFDEERYRRNLIREGREEGRVEGREEGRVEGRKEGREEAREEVLARLADSIRAGAATVELAVSLGFTREEVESRVAEVGQS